MMIAKVLQLLQPDEKRRGLKVIASVIISAVLDFVSVAMLLPLLYFLLDGVAQQQATLLFCVLAIMALLLKAIFSTFLTRFQQKFLLDVYKRMSFSLLERYYQNGLLFIKEKGVNKLSYEVNFVCYAFGQNTLLPFMNICGEGLLILLMMIAVFVYDWSIALILLLSFAPMLLIYVFGLRQKVREFGRLELEARRKQSRVVMEIFAGYAELEVNDAFTAKSEDFCEGMNKIADSRMKMETLSKLPLLMSELSAVIGLGALAFYADGDVKAIVGIFAVAAFRMLPAFRSILSNWSHIQNSASGVQVIEEGLSELSDTMQAPESLCFKEEICLKNLFHQYDDNQKLISDFNETIRKGEYVGFCGFSGVGKSTLLNLLLGFIRPVSGEILIDNTPLSIDNRSSWLKMIGYVQQDVFLFNASLAENIALGYKNINQVKLADVLEKVCLSDWAAELPDGMDTVLGEFGARVSGGQRQRIGIARALYKEASVLLLDEATSALDDATEKEINIMIDRLRRSGEGLTILSVAHRASTLSYCDRIVKMH